MMEEPKAGFTIDNMPAQHVFLFLPWIHEKLSPKVILANKDNFCLDDDESNLLVDLVMADAGKYADEIFQTYLKLFERKPLAAKAIAKWFIQDSGHPVSKRMLFDDMDKKAFEVYVKEFLGNRFNDNLVIRLSTIIRVMDIAIILRKTDVDRKYQELSLMEKNGYSFEDPFETWRSRCLLLIKFIITKPRNRKHENWLYEFMIVCNCSPITRVYAYLIDPNFKLRIEEYQIMRESEKPTPVKFNEDLVFEEPPTSPRPQSFFGAKSEEVTGIISIDYNLYKYQDELADAAKRGKNTIIIAPTGSGKTLVAVEIIASHLRHVSLQGVARAVVFVPTIPLLEQHYTYIHDKIGAEFYVTKLSGNDRGKNVKLVNAMAGDIFICTPQIFVNMLLSPLKSQKIYITDFTLMIFDECHHCNENHPYNVLMGYVRNSQYQPQIVGLTASVASGKKFRGTGRLTAEDVIKDIAKLCARLLAQTVTTVKDSRNILDLKSKISEPVDEFIALAPPLEDDFAHEIALICDYIEYKMEADLKHLQIKIPNLKDDDIRLQKEKNDHLNGSTKTSIAYYSKLLWIRAEVEKKLTDSKEMKLFVLKCVKLLNMMYYTLKYNELFPASIAMNYLKARLQEFQNADMFENVRLCPLSAEKLNDLRQLYNKVESFVAKASFYIPQSEDKPILSKLIEILQNHGVVSDNGESEESTSTNPRIIIFVDMRKVGSDLCRYLNTHPAIIEKYGERKVGYIASTSQGTSKYGQSAGEQEEMLELFRNGAINILIATSVAEEGLDIAECNLIIKYNSVGSQKSFTQRRGRARAKGSKAILLALEEKTLRKEVENVRREFLMNLCMRSLHTMHENELFERIQKEYDEIKRSAQAEAQDERRVKACRNNMLYELLCKACNKVFCKSDDCFSLDNNEVACCNPSCWKDTKIQRQNWQKNKNDVVSIRCGAWLCEVCGSRRGTVLKYGGTYLPTIASDSFM